MPPEQYNTSMSSDIILKGSLRKAKNWNKRFFVLRDGTPARLEYYENERRWKANKPKRCISLEKPWNIGKQKDSKHEFLIVIFTEDEYFIMAADNAEVQSQWVNALQRAVRPEPGSLLFKHVWHVLLENKELVDVSKSSLLMSLQGPHRVCLTHDQMVFVHANNNGAGDRSRGEPIEIRIASIRVCGHKETMFFIVPGRASGIGNGNSNGNENGKLWMDVNDEVTAAQMHSTILDLMYALKQEEDRDSRGRANSSGSNSGRMRSVRSQTKTLPPKHIGMGIPPKHTGMGKVPTIMSSCNKRLRCDSLPASHIGGPNESRLRTGSEGETTMNRPHHFCRRGMNGSVSPRMKSRMLHHHKRGLFHCHHHHGNVSHSHTVSLPGSCNSSSAASSTEHLNSGLASSSDLSNCSYPNGASQLPTVAQSPLVGETQFNEDLVGGHSPTQGYMQLGNLRCNPSTRTQPQSSGGRNNVPEYASQVNYALYQDTYHDCCSNCMSQITTSQMYGDPYYVHQRVQFPSTEQAPPPPNVQPPQNPLETMAAASSPAIIHEFVSVNVHSRTVSLDDTLNCDVRTSIPVQHSSGFDTNAETNDYVPMSKQVETLMSSEHNGRISSLSSSRDDESPPPTPNSASPKDHSLPSHNARDTFSLAVDEYAVMGGENSSTYPHQSMTSGNYKSSSHGPSILAKLVSLASGSSSPSTPPCQHRGASPTSEYTPMNPCVMSSQTLETNCRPGNIVKHPTVVCHGYVPMRSFASRSLPKDIENRRRSVPNAVLRHSDQNPQSTSPCGQSPDKPYESINPLQNFCSACAERLAASQHIDEDTEYSEMRPVSSRFDWSMKFPTENYSVVTNSTPTRPTAITTAPTGYLSPPVTLDATSRMSTPSPSMKSSDEYLSMRPLQQELHDIGFNKVNRPRAETGESSQSNISSSASESGMCMKETDMSDGGYLPMSPLSVSGLNGQAVRKTVVSGILSVAMETPFTPRYPHQKKINQAQVGYSTCSLDRPKKLNHKRPKSLAFRYSSTCSTRRTQSLRHGKKATPAPTIDISLASQAALPSTGSTQKGSTSPGGEYVNIDYEKAKEQAAQCPYLIKSSFDSQGIAKSPRLAKYQGITLEKSSP